MVICFLGHHDIIVNDIIKNKIEENLLKFLPNNDLICLCGGYGNYDIACAKVCNKLKQNYPNVKIVFVTPYISSSYQQKLKTIKKSNLYDEIVYPQLENVPLKFAIAKRNEWMINNADVVIAFVQHHFSNSYKFLEYAKCAHKFVINIANDMQ